MNKIQLFFLLRKNTKLSEKRHPMFEANQYGKLIGYIVISIVAIEFLALGTFFGWLAAKEDVPEMIFYIMPFFLIFDFSGRFATLLNASLSRRFSTWAISFGWSPSYLTSLSCGVEDCQVGQLLECFSCSI